jgi:hypothetical protein
MPDVGVTPRDGAAERVRDSKSLMNVFLDGEKLFEWEASGAELGKLVSTLQSSARGAERRPTS